MRKVSLNDCLDRYILQCILRVIAGKTKSVRNKMVYEGMHYGEYNFTKIDLIGKMSFRRMGGFLALHQYLNYLLKEQELLFPAGKSRGQILLLEEFDKSNPTFYCNDGNRGTLIIFNPHAVKYFLEFLREREGEYILKSKYLTFNILDGALNITERKIKPEDKKGKKSKIKLVNKKTLKMGSVNYRLLVKLMTHRRITAKDIRAMNLKNPERKISDLRKILGIAQAYDSRIENTRADKSKFLFEIKLQRNGYILVEN